MRLLVRLRGRRAFLYQQKKFVSLSGDTESQGDLKSVVLHSITAKSVNSNFPIAIGAKIHGVEEKSYSSTGSAYSMIVMPNQKSHAEEVLQEEDVSVAYDFAKRYPGYSAENLTTKAMECSTTTTQTFH